MTTPEPADAIVADDKDWTWVLRRACPECGLDTREVPPTEVAARLRANAARWPAVLQRDQVGRRTDPARWSDLEYACHVRDVFRLFDRRLVLMLEQDDPLFANWNQDETAIAERYADSDPDRVASELLEAAATLADRFDAVSPQQWQRTGRRSDGANFTVETFALYLLHDPVHHLADVEG